jgi:hypothetical protein
LFESWRLLGMTGKKVIDQGKDYGSECREFFGALKVECLRHLGQSGNVWEQILGKRRPGSYEQWKGRRREGKEAEIGRKLRGKIEKMFVMMKMKMWMNLLIALSCRGVGG